MPKKISDTLSYLIECVNAESRESFKILENSKNLFFFADEGKVVEDFFFSDESYVEIKPSDSLKNYITWKNAHHKNDKIYLALEYILDHSAKRKFLIPLYLVEILIEDIDDNFRISKVDYEPTFNYSLFPGFFTINEVLLIAEEIDDEQSWNEKISVFLDNLDKNFANRTKSAPFLFSGNLLQSIQATVTRELEWIKTKYLKDLKNTSLAFLFENKCKIERFAKPNPKYIEIFPLNEIQNEVVNYSLTNPFTVITGPPGTGKSQVVLNILANLYFNNKTVLFASKNNKAVNTVLEKLETIQDNYCCFVRLGNKQEKRKGLAKILDLLNYERSSKKHSVSYSEINQNLKEINFLNDELKKLDEYFKNYVHSVSKFGNKKREFPNFIDECLDSKSFRSNVGNFLEINRSFKNELKSKIMQQKSDRDLHKAEILKYESKKKDIENLKSGVPKELKNVFSSLEIDKYSRKNHNDIIKFKKDTNEKFCRYVETNKFYMDALYSLKEIESENINKRYLIAEFLKSNFDAKLIKILKTHLAILKDDIKINFLDLKKLKTDIQDFQDNRISIFKKILKIIYPSYFKNNFFKELKRHFEALPEYLSEYISKSLTDTSTDNLVWAISNLENIVQFIDMSLEHNEIKNKLIDKQKNLAELKYMLNELTNEDVENQLNILLSVFPKNALGFYKGSIQKCTTKLEYSLKFVDAIESFSEAVLEYNQLRKELKGIKEEINKIEDRLSDHYHEPLYSKIDKYFLELTQGLNAYLKTELKSRDLDYYYKVMATLENFLVSFIELQKIELDVIKDRKKLKNCTAMQDIERKLENTKKNLIGKSRQIFNDFLYSKINLSKAEFRQAVTDYYENWKDEILIDLFNKISICLGIIVTTNLSTRFNIPNKPNIFDYVIIDEASQNDIPSVLPLLFRAENAVIIGDPNQLRHISTLKDKYVEEIASKYNINEELINFHYNKNSAYQIAQRRFTEMTMQSPFILKNHYRCHENIIRFSNINFYNSALFPKSYLMKNVTPLTPGIYWRSIKGNYRDKSNPNEALAIVDFLKEIYRQGLRDTIDIGIVTPFRNQKMLITKLLYQNSLISGKDSDKILASTVHSFQGDEKDVIIYSPVMCSGIAKKTLEWLDKSTDLLNVAVTRAKNVLIIFGDSKFVAKTNGLHKRLLNYCTEIIKRQETPYFESATEELFYNKLIKEGINFEYQVPVGRYRIDFLLKSNDKYLCIELDGGQHFHQKSYDYSRENYLKSIGYDIIRFPNTYIEQNSKEIINSLKLICAC